MNFRKFRPLVLFPMVLWSCSSSEEKIYPSRERVSESIYASGTIRSKNQYQAYLNATGTVQEIFLQEGDSVEVGTPILAIFNESARVNRELAELNRAYSDIQANQNRLKDLEVNINLAKNKMVNDSLLWVRQRRLKDQGIGSSLEFEQRELAYQNSRTSYETSVLRYNELKREIEFNERSASKNLAISRALESDLVLKSEVKGLVYSILKEKGEMVNAQTPLAILGSGEEFVLEMLVDEYDISKVEKGQKILVNMDSYRGEVFEAVVSKINPIMDERNKTFLVEGVFVEQPSVLYPNLSLEANIIIQVKDDVLIIPRSFLLNESFVLSSDRDTIKVEVGIKDFQKAEIISGIDENMALIKP
ncbi:efflux RND transporter periplasmic adaptor subunit [Arthrospiribacter ruber]|uniref:HlyD family efflux transporter periplasmic adaptor subunit n=1 Tax=Arthrospiribacter ruber TaxID=2487934 RepID=A0A951IXH8_9BACT|nr:efflux RND transporter periplasmic adaptor subunit [Arthrospiribacter ruber]MBW3467303.1 HlyD family efflux transporter periplasmic adaptor subunit [Arthrospiribacter ruber]